MCKKVGGEGGSPGPPKAGVSRLKGADPRSGKGAPAIDKSGGEPHAAPPECWPEWKPFVLSG